MISGTQSAKFGISSGENPLSVFNKAELLNLNFQSANDMMKDLELFKNKGLRSPQMRKQAAIKELKEFRGRNSKVRGSLHNKWKHLKEFR